jgi:hypothetical protein
LSLNDDTGTSGGSGSVVNMSKRRRRESPSLLGGIDQVGSLQPSAKGSISSSRSVSSKSRQISRDSPSRELITNSQMPESIRIRDVALASLFPRASIEVWIPKVELKGKYYKISDRTQIEHANVQSKSHVSLEYEGGTGNNKVRILTCASVA